MAKRYFILFWLFAAYAVVFAHSVVPHVHEEEQKAQATHHHHDGDHHHEDDHHDEESGEPDNVFHLFQHHDIRADFFVPTLPLSASGVNKDFVEIYFTLQQLARLCDEGPPLRHFAKESPHFQLQQQHSYFYGVKAPPVWS